MREENNSELKGILKILGPGTSLREGIENILNIISYQNKIGNYNSTNW